MGTWPGPEPRGHGSKLLIFSLEKFSGGGGDIWLYCLSRPLFLTLTLQFWVCFRLEHWPGPWPGPDVDLELDNTKIVVTSSYIPWSSLISTSGLGRRWRSRCRYRSPCGSITWCTVLGTRYILSFSSSTFYIFSTCLQVTPFILLIICPKFTFTKVFTTLLASPWSCLSVSSSTLFRNVIMVIGCSIIIAFFKKRANFNLRNTDKEASDVRIYQKSQIQNLDKTECLQMR